MGSGDYIPTCAATIMKRRRQQAIDFPHLRCTSGHENRDRVLPAYAASGFGLQEGHPQANVLLDACSL